MYYDRVLTMSARAETDRRRPHQITNRVVMIPPDQFGFNDQTAASNEFQHRPADELATRDLALAEFYGMVSTLKVHGIDVAILPSRTDVVTPDAVFPNNWFSLHETAGSEKSKVVIYPMCTPNRRDERQVENLQGALTTIGVESTEVVDMSRDEKENKILEGTGSLVLDRKNGVAYALGSERTTKEEFDIWCREMDYEGVFFHAEGKTGKAIYHTNVAMSVGEGFAVLCSEAIPDAEERERVKKSLQKHGELIEITSEQMDGFAGNILNLKSQDGDSKIVMSQHAFDAFTPEQRKTLEKYGELVPVHIPTIEDVGGGSARCMIAEVFPPRE